MFRNFWLLDGKKPVAVKDVIEWKLKFEKMNRTVNKTIVGKFCVSTVFLGLDHNLHQCGDPILFESCIFDDNGNNEVIDRYSTWDEAARGHNMIAAILVFTAPKAEEPKDDWAGREGDGKNFLFEKPMCAMCYKKLTERNTVIDKNGIKWDVCLKCKSKVDWSTYAL